VSRLGRCPERSQPICSISLNQAATSVLFQLPGGFWAFGVLVFVLFGVFRSQRQPRVLVHVTCKEGAPRVESG
jgi:hypothetical protein